MYTGLPITFLLGFYVSLVVSRWWEQYCKLPWPDTIAIYMKGLVRGESARIVRRTVVRYCVLSYILCIRRLSVRLRKRFPSMQEIVRTGVMRPDEAVRIGDEDSPDMYGSNWWKPLQWSAEILTQAQEDGMIANAPGFKGLISKVAEFRSDLTSVAAYGHIPVPLVYTQVVTLAVYFYFGVSLIGEQWLLDEEIDLYYPIFMTIKFLFLFGWLRVAETLYNPFGEDDEDFELNELLNRHFRVGMSIVDDSEAPPELGKDLYWNQKEPDLSDLSDDNHDNSDAEHCYTKEQVLAMTVIYDKENNQKLHKDIFLDQEDPELFNLSDLCRYEHKSSLNVSDYENDDNIEKEYRTNQELRDPML